MVQNDGFIGVFDSGVGGISVLKSLVNHLPYERFVFFGDSANAPYGDKCSEEIYELSKKIVEDFIQQGAKAIVIACNTATSVAAKKLRETYPDLPIIGIEPALKPAALAQDHGSILVMATSKTLKLDKFAILMDEYGKTNDVHLVACPGLADAIEIGYVTGSKIYRILEELIGNYRGKIDSVVLGCTHYPFIKEAICDILGGVKFFDGCEGTARQLAKVLKDHDLLNTKSTLYFDEHCDSRYCDEDYDEGALSQSVIESSYKNGYITLLSSIDTPEEIELYERFLGVRD